MCSAAGDVLDREQPHDPPLRTDDAERPPFPVEQVDEGLAGGAVGHDLQRVRPHGQGHRVLAGTSGGQHALAQVGVGHHPHAVGALDERGAHRALGHGGGRLADRRRRAQDERVAVDQGAHPPRAELRQRVHRVAGADQAVTEAAGDVGHAGGVAEHPQRGTLADQQARDVGVRTHGERRGEAREQRRMAEALARLEHVDDLVAVDELHRPAAHDVEPGGGIAVLHQQRGARLAPHRHRRLGRRGQLLRRQRVERRVAGKEGGDGQESTIR